MNAARVDVTEHALRRYVERVLPRAAPHAEVVREQIRKRLGALAHRVDPADESGSWVRLKQLGIAVCAKVDEGNIVVVTIVPVAWWLAREVVRARDARAQARQRDDNAEEVKLGQRVGALLEDLRRTPEWARHKGAANPVRAILAAAKKLGHTEQRCSVGEGA